MAGGGSDAAGAAAVEEMDAEVVIVGAGIAGLATALALRRAGVARGGVVVLERHAELRATGAALTIFPNGWFALRALGVAHKLTSRYEAYQTSRVTNLETEATQVFRFAGNKDCGEEVRLRPLDRKALLEALAEELSPGTIRFSSKLASINTEPAAGESPETVVLRLDDGTVIRAKVLIGCDGVHSVVARWLGLSEPVSSGRSAVRGLSIFPGGHGVKRELRQFLSEGLRAGMVPISDTDIYWFLVNNTIPAEKDAAADPVKILQEVTDNLGKHMPPEYLDVVRHSDLGNLSWAPLLYRNPLSLLGGKAACGPITVAGDAFHPMTPDMAQGGCSALEDAVVLARALSRAATPAEGMSVYVAERRWRVAWLVTGAYLSGWVQQGGTNVTAPLRLDAQGREVDEFGNVVSSRAQPVTTLRVNQGLPLTAAPSSSLLSPSSSSFLQAPTQQPAQPQQQQQYQQEEEVDASQFFDPRMGGGALKKLKRRARATFDFVQEGELQRQAEAFRSQARYGRDGKGGPPGGGGALPPLPRLPIGPLGVGQGSDQAGQAGGASREATPGTEEPDEPDEQVPAVEWWDKGLLAFGSYEQDVPEEADQPVQLNDRKITLYVEHPVPIEPPAEGPPPAPQPLKLTAREVKKLRTQRRLAREKEKQDLIRQGLLEPPKPKVKISNLYRVLGEQAVLDPTAIELETRKQMAERQQAHEDRNMARALTPAERRDKKERKLFDETGLETITSVYRVERMDHAQNRYKVEINAKENRMTGVLLITPSFSLVVVEGCNKSTKRYAKLMLRRIDWTAPPPPPKSGGRGQGGMDEGEDGQQEEEEDEDRPENRCDLVWQGLVKEPAFEKFKAEVCNTVEHAQQVLAQHNVLHYWDAAKNFVPGESVGVTLLS